MRILALGGCGGMGRYAVRTALGFDFVEEVLVADRDADAAARFGQQCGARVFSAGVDANDAGALRELMADVDVVLNTVGPFYRFGAPILEAAIDSGSHYFDINDDWEPTLDMLALSGRAENAGVTAILGLGASPGVSNLLAVKAIRGLDSVDEVLTGWSLEGTATEEADEDSAKGEPSAAIVHWMHQCSGSIRLWQEGAFVDVQPVQERRIEYPGVGAGRVWTVGHPEAVTLPLSFPEIRHSANVMVGPPFLMKSLVEIRDAIDAGQLTVEQAAAMMAGPMPDGMKGAAAEDRADQGVRLPPLFALALGEREGSPHAVATMVLGAPRGGMGGITGIPLALGLPLLHAGRLERRGVFAPEGAVDPDAFFSLLAPHCEAPGSAAGFKSSQELVMMTEAPLR